MNILEETRFRLNCCRGGTHEGWGELRSLRNHLQCRVDHRLGELGPFVEEIRVLPEDDELRTDETVVSLLQEYDDLAAAKREALAFLGDEPGEPYWTPGCAIQQIDRTERLPGETEPEKPRNLAQRLLSSCLPTFAPDPASDPSSERTRQRRPQSYLP